MLQVKSKQQIIDAIRQHNRSAAQDFLINFEERALQIYLKRLTQLQNNRGPDTTWVRHSGTRAIATLAH